MQEIASEFSINWDSKAFKLRMSRSSATAQVLSSAFCTGFVVKIEYSDNSYFVSNFENVCKIANVCCTGPQCMCA